MLSVTHIPDTIVLKWRVREIKDVGIVVGYPK